MSYTVIIPKPVQKQLDNLPEDIRQRITAKILSLTIEPRPVGVKKLKGFDNEYRVRVGDYRVRYEVNDKILTVLVLHCKHRRNIYRE
ncbi:MULTISPECIES: type II toxin-antitoxin system RelE family toxin [Planktothrix]|jgi:mRNA interferase RelE/StbE|uniref:type II toxin-antitoxin system RelE family toxin n=1 Tax=Planktothrix TaxID=54304 RepID=UPI00040B37A3|nr:MULTISPECIES: type II toxin-antitoxin system RelE/ParE family toxin [Planktothrix]CAD5923608.1 Plasmid stabilization system protein [Planktothrix rubescens]MCB8784878.1 type II toxin-antitoxin system RelE/ParE family toxin [Planktothrix agardhii 1025]MCF3578786.1 type II toxin-antitoxin system RelE/ParE family toxin [Planktothrix agardhii 1812]MCF3611041.1 type II toxin-antitoxin system RelE/ParE family toxin [Planktothrix agardhii 1027]MCF3644694.1 type II toxin-antitoxin system RelE/ParE 